MRVRIECLGCRLNLGEMDALARILARKGLTIVPPGEAAELCFLNTCTVTATAAKKSRQALRRLRKTLPGARLVVTGCFSQLSAEICRDLGADLVVSNEDKDRIVRICEERGFFDVPGPPEEWRSVFSPRHTRAFLKVQDGCDNTCSYCVVTIARGPARSIGISRVISEIHGLEEAGFREVVLSGVHLGSWGRDLDPPRKLEDLLDTVLERTSIERIRLSSLEPWDLDRGFFRVFSSPRIQPHLHLPLQSGSARILKKMARQTTPEAFERLVAQARESIPDLAVSTDIIVGFPSETGEDFRQTVEFVRKIAFSKIHLFRFSARKGTPAARMAGHVDGGTISARVRELSEIAHEQEVSFMRRFLGRVVPILWEDSEEIPSGLLWSGLSPNYLRVVARTPPGIDLENRITPVVLKKGRPGALEGHISCLPLDLRQKNRNEV